MTIEEIPNIPDNPVITNLNSLLSDIFVRYIKLSEFGLHYKVFDTIFQDLHKKMKEVDPYYRKYSSTVCIYLIYNIISLSILNSPFSYS